MLEAQKEIIHLRQALQRAQEKMQAVHKEYQFMKTKKTGSHLVKHGMLKFLGLFIVSISLVALSMPLMTGSLLNPRSVHAQTNDASQPTLQALR